MVLNLEQLSIENLINFYKKELKMIDLGKKKASTLFSDNMRRRLIKKGILKRSKMSKEWITTISDSTRTLISQAEQ